MIYANYNFGVELILDQPWAFENSGLTCQMMQGFLKINFTDSFRIVLKVAPFADVLKLDRTGRQAGLFSNNYRQASQKLVEQRHKAITNCQLLLNNMKYFKFEFS
uniref:Uncharacterized protein n=1 Tax=Micrurus corallinus TaxID=54390 RepID=A0A2D4FQM9_MICCO